MIAIVTLLLFVFAVARGPLVEQLLIAWG
ncbi:hypothetical protein [Candidatus Rhodoblastus alkanivorans]